MTRRPSHHTPQAAPHNGPVSFHLSMPHWWPSVMAAWGLCATGMTPVWAQAPAATPEAALAPVVIVGTTPLPGTPLEKKQVPAPVQTADAQALEDSQARDLADFMAQHLGSVHVNEIQGNPYQLDVNYRGFTASPLLGTPQGLSVYMDGMRMNQAFGDVMSWDLIPKAAIGSMTLMPGSNPLFGLNTLGGALVVQTKDGLSHPGTSLKAMVGSNAHRSLELTHGGRNDQGLHWFGTANLARDRGWRDDSPSDVQQWFGKVGWVGNRTQWAISAAHANNELNGNGLQDQRLLDQNWRSVYTHPDITRNRSTLLNATLQHEWDSGLSFSGTLYARRIRTSTYNADINEGSLDQSVYQPSVADRAALTKAGYTGFPTSGATAANTPFPFWRCIAQALQNDEPGEKCTGLINQTQTTQSQYGLSGQWSWRGTMAGQPNQTTVGAAYDTSRVQFHQTAELGYLTANRGVTGVGAFADGVTGGDVDGVPYDSRVNLNGRSRVASVYAMHTQRLGEAWHLTAAGRYNHQSIRNTDLIHAADTPASLSGEHRFHRLNPALGLTYAPSKALTAYAGYSEGSRSPSTIELGCANPEQPCKLPNAMAGDPPLQQVVTRTWELGVRGTTSEGWNWQAGAFSATNRNDILFVADDQAGFGYFKNFGKTRRQGIELGADTRMGAWRLGVQYAWLDARFESAEVLNGTGNSSNEDAQAGRKGLESTIAVRPGDRIPLIPRHVLKWQIGYQINPAWSVGVGVVHQSGMLARGNENNAHQADGTYYLGAGETKPFTVVNLKVQYKPSAKMTWFFKIDNLFDRRYVTAAQLGPAGLNAQGQFVARALPAVNGQFPVAQTTFVAPGAPRTVWLGLKYIFD